MLETDVAKWSGSVMSGHVPAQLICFTGQSRHCPLSQRVRPLPLSGAAGAQVCRTILRAHLCKWGNPRFPHLQRCVLSWVPWVHLCKQGAAVHPGIMTQALPLQMGKCGQLLLGLQGPNSVCLGSTCLGWLESMGRSRLSMISLLKTNRCPLKNSGTKLYYLSSWPQICAFVM